MPVSTGLPSVLQGQFQLANLALPCSPKWCVGCCIFIERLHFWYHVLETFTKVFGFFGDKKAGCVQTLPVLLVFSIIPIEHLLERGLFFVHVNVLLTLFYVHYHY